MSSSRSIAAARARRAGEAAPPVSGNRPGTSIGSHAAFAPQPPGYQPNVRTTRTAQPPQPQYQQKTQYQQQQYQQQQYQQPTPTNGLPFNKLSISDAVGLITLRLGRVEQFMIELQHDGVPSSNETAIPENSKIIDNSVLTTMISRLDSLEKREPSQPVIAQTTPSVNLDDFNKLVEDVKRLNDEVIKHNLTIAKHTEQMFRVERDTVETRDMLKTLMLKFDMFVNETNTRFGDYEYALGELEKNIPVPQEAPSNEEDNNASTILTEESVNLGNPSIIEESVPENDSSSLMTINASDLKNIIQQELANEM
jgi:hypothetical protein